MSDRKLASVRRIVDISEIPGADKIVCVTVDGWNLVSNKENGFKVNDLVIYFEIDSFLPIIPQFEWMRDRCYKNTENLGEGFRVRTIKLRGQVSQGLIVPLSDFCRQDEGSDGWYIKGHLAEKFLEEGDDLTEAIGVQKYEKPIPAQLAGTVRGNFPSFIPKTDQERVQNCWGSIKNWMFYAKPNVHEIVATDPHYADLIMRLEAGEFKNTDERHFFKNGDMWFLRESVKNPEDIVAERSRFEGTLKLDGSSMTVYYYEGQIGVCSRNNDLKRTEENTFWNVAVRSGLIATLAELGLPIAFQGELMGPGIQGNRESLDEAMFFVYDIYDIARARYFTPDERKPFFDNLRQGPYINQRIIHHVPLVENVVLHEDLTVDDLLKSAETKSIFHSIAEGIVFKSYVSGGPSFKAISNRFLLKEQD